MTLAEWIQDFVQELLLTCGLLNGHEAKNELDLGRYQVVYGSGPNKKRLTATFRIRFGGEADCIEMSLRSGYCSDLHLRLE